ncbi:DUF7000 family protein [Chloroflexota bacterium]
MPEYIKEYKKQLGKGVIQRAYQGLMKYIMDLRTHFSKNFPDFAPGNIYHGYMDMTYFPISPKSLKSRKLKIAVVFNYDQFRFEVWLAGYNKQIQQKYWILFQESDWNKYRIPSAIKGVDSIAEYTLAENPDFDDLDGLTKQIEKGTLNFISDIEDFLSKL